MQSWQIISKNYKLSQTNSVVQAYHHKQNAFLQKNASLIVFVNSEVLL